MPPSDEPIISARDIQRWKTYFKHRDAGMSVELSSAKASLAPATAYRFERGEPGNTGLLVAARLNRPTPEHTPTPPPSSAPTTTHQVPLAAQEALEDFPTFRRRYFGRHSVPWQAQAAEKVRRLVKTKEKEFIVMNEPPGSGKSTLFTHDIVCWLIATNRDIRIQIGSRTERQARMYVNRVKRSLERDDPMRSTDDDKRLGRSVDAIATLSGDFGSFRPERGDLWRAEALVVRNPEGRSTDDKEPTVSAWGMDSGFLGGRFDLIIWDDLVDSKNTRSPESRDNLAELYFSEMETRLEPGGCLVLQGQRIAPDDLYRTALDQTTWDDKPKYTHIVFKAHDDERCVGRHEGSRLEPWPKGCLLDPYRLPWRNLQTIRKNNPRTFELMYQQTDGTDLGGLVERLWLEGGVDQVTGDTYPGCLDSERTNRQMPAAAGPFWSYITIDPSPTEYWGILRWLYDQHTKTWHIMDIHRLRLRPDDLLDHDADTDTFSGLLVRMMEQAEADQTPVTDVIVEINAAQRWLLVQPHVQRFQRQTKVRFIQHTTTRNKLDPDFGVESLSGPFRHGRIRIPWGSPATKMEYKPYMDELLQYPDGATTDLVMSTWFSVLAVNNHNPGIRRGATRKQGPPLYADIRRGIA